MNNNHAIAIMNTGVSVTHKTLSNSSLVMGFENNLP